MTKLMYKIDMELLPLGLLRQPYLKPGGQISFAPRPATPKGINNYWPTYNIGFAIIIGNECVRHMRMRRFNTVTVGSGIIHT